MSVKMHDVVRDVIISIASCGERFILRYDHWLKQLQFVNVDKSGTAISLNSNEFDKLPADLNYPNLQLFQLQSILCSGGIPDNFFEGLKEVKSYWSDSKESSVQSPCKLFQVPMVTFPCLEIVEVYNVLVDGQMLARSLCKELIVPHCKSLQAVFSFKGNQAALDQLNSLDLKNLPKLVEIWRIPPPGN
ncbi:hypothetical protein M9H77_09360 [Catharanthus roseus]|uniref:Uncharacterized protein n=1 Tax=Catharanthus roseus TaxID=4058 RepID=A0ACC0C0F1_CATRO|nr:hypothetical protein M9H77_09360 [Catharanthus roseus]